MSRRLPVGRTHAGSVALACIQSCGIDFAISSRSMIRWIYKCIDCRRSPVPPVGNEKMSCPACLENQRGQVSLALKRPDPFKLVRSFSFSFSMAINTKNSLGNSLRNLFLRLSRQSGGNLLLTKHGCFLGIHSVPGVPSRKINLCLFKRLTAYFKPT